ncbi:terpene cyclase/mutase family protein, partial [Patescibacteria group bacterium]|nr:terpene cyclase/mutase family protein [Patescibacteria group bacterium]
EVLATTTPIVELPEPVTEPVIATTTGVVATSTEFVTASTTDAVAISTEPTPTALPSVDIALTVATGEHILFADSITVTACAPRPDMEPAVSGYCALEQSGAPMAWTWYGNDAFVDSISGVGNDYEGNAYWNWFSDLSYGMTSLNAHTLHAGESLIVSIGRFPLRLQTTSDSEQAGNEIIITVEQFSFDSTYSPIWEPAASSTIVIHDTLYETTGDGTLSYNLPASDSIEIHARKEGYLDATPLTVRITEAPESDTGSSSNPGPVPKPADAVAAAASFLLEYQHADGSFGTSLLSDWAALAFKSANMSTRTLKEYLEGGPGSLKTATDFERRAMALSALRINPVQKVSEVLNRFDGTQIGDPSLWNDDIFGLIALRAGGYDESDIVIRSVAASLIAVQKSDGSWGGVDLTAASIQALVPISSLPSAESALAKAREYLVSRQQPDGCFGNSFATSWSIMAIEAIGESPNTWTMTGGATPLSCLRALQSPDGGFEAGASEDTRIWATAYALPALTGKTWDSLLIRYPKAQSIDTPPINNSHATSTDEVLPPEDTTLPIAVPTPIELPIISEIVSEPFIAKIEEASPILTNRRLAASAGSALADTGLPAEQRSNDSGLWVSIMRFLMSLFGFLF